MLCNKYMYLPKDSEYLFISSSLEFYERRVFNDQIIFLGAGNLLPFMHFYRKVWIFFFR